MKFRIPFFMNVINIYCKSVCFPSVVVNFPEGNQEKAKNHNSIFNISTWKSNRFEYNDINNHYIKKNGSRSGKKQPVGSKRLSYCYSSPNRRELGRVGTE